MRVLLIEDDKAMARAVNLMLTSEGLDVHAADLGECGLKLAKRHDYDVVILDLQLPDIPGLEVLQSLRSAGVPAPVLVLSGNIQTDAKIKALNAGADDYMTKPFHKSELVARIYALARRIRIQPPRLITTGKLTVDLNAKTVEACGRKVNLTIKEYEMLELLCDRKGVTVTKEAFITRLYADTDPPEQKIVDVFICKLRKKLTAATNGEHCIMTIWARGYMLCDPPTIAIGQAERPQRKTVAQADRGRGMDDADFGTASLVQSQNAAA
jgi:two-component system cell cycle response regulator CtrA